MRFYTPSASEFGAVPNHENKDKLGFVFLKVVQLLTAPLLLLLSQGLSGSFPRCLLVIANNVSQRGEHLEPHQTWIREHQDKSRFYLTMIENELQNLFCDKGLLSIKLKWQTTHQPRVCDKMTNEITTWRDTAPPPHPTYARSTARPHLAAFLTFHKKETSVLNAAARFVVSIFRNHPGDDKRDAGVHREAHARRHSGVAETGRGGQPAGLAGRHTGKTGNQNNAGWVEVALKWCHPAIFTRCLDFNHLSLRSSDTSSK